MTWSNIILDRLPTGDLYLFLLIFYIHVYIDNWLLLCLFLLCMMFMWCYWHQQTTFSVCVCVSHSVCVCVLLVVCRSCGGCQDRGFLRNKAWQAQLGMVWKELAKIGKPHVNTHLQLCLFVTVNFVAIHTRTQYRNRLKLGNLNRLFLQCMIDYHLNTFCPPWTPIWRARE